jgi:hypothetical protein
VKTRKFKIDFYCVTSKGKRKHKVISNALKAIELNGCTEAIALEGGDEKHQLRSVVSVASGNVIKAVFGRCRYNEELTQGDDTGSEADVPLKPGHGLVEKNYLLFIPNQNLIVYQRNSNGSHHSKLQAYLNRLLGEALVLEPILQRDAYKKLIDGGEVKRFEVSFVAPADATLYEGILTSKATEMLKECGASSGHIKMSVGRKEGGLQDWIKSALQSLARSGLSTVARVKVGDVDHPIDLIADRLVMPAAVSVNANGRASADDYYAALENARTDASSALETFFGS